MQECRADAPFCRQIALSGLPGYAYAPIFLNQQDYPPTQPTVGVNR